MSIEAEITRKLFRKYDLDIHEVVQFSFLSPTNIFPGEQNCREFRVSLGTINTLEWVLDMYNHNTIESFDKEQLQDKNHLKSNNLKPDALKKALANLKKQRIEFVEQLTLIGKTRDNGEHLEFSVFVKGETKSISLKNEQDVLFIYESVYDYMRFLYGIYPDLYNGKICENLYREDVDAFKLFLEETNVKITNANIEYIDDIAYRLYKDSKLFADLEDFLGVGTYEQFIRDFEYILNNDIEDIDFDAEILNNVV